MLKKEEKQSVSILEDTAVLKIEHYEMGLLWQKDKPKLPYNRWLATPQLQNLERKLVKSSVLAEKYKNTIQEDLDRGNT